jgi:hypothetical protein
MISSNRGESILILRYALKTNRVSTMLLELAVLFKALTAIYRIILSLVLSRNSDFRISNIR